VGSKRARKQTIKEGKRQDPGEKKKRGGFSQVKKKNKKALQRGEGKKLTGGRGG